MNVKLDAVTPDPERIIERAGRNCYGNTKRDSSIIQRWIKSGHLTTIEHASATFRISGVSRALMAQLTRHRIASFSIRSQRYCKENNFGYVTPEDITNNVKAAEIYTLIMQQINIAYNELMECGIDKEDARMVLPNAAETEIYMTMNFRELRHFFELRCSKEAQSEIRDMSKKMLDILYPIAPNVFQDLYWKYNTIGITQ